MNFSDSSGVIRSIFEMPPKLEPKYKLWVPRFGANDASGVLVPIWESVGVNYFFKFNVYPYSINTDPSVSTASMWLDGRTTSGGAHATRGILMQYNIDGLNCFKSYYGIYHIDGVKYSEIDNQAQLYKNKWSSIYVGNLSGQTIDSPKSIAIIGMKSQHDGQPRGRLDGCLAYLILQDSDAPENTRHYPMVLDQAEKPTVDKVYDIFDPSGQRYIQLSPSVEWVECPPGLSNWAERYSDEF